MNFKKRLITSLGFVVVAVSLVIVVSGSVNAQDVGATAFAVSDAPGSSSDNLHTLTFNIPAGKRLVIERLEVAVITGHGVPIGLPKLNTMVNGNAVTHVLPVPSLEVTGGVPQAPVDYYLLFMAPNVVADAGTVTLSLEVQYANVFMTVSGHLVCPQTPPCDPTLGVSNGSPAKSSVTTDSTAAQAKPGFALPSKRETVAKLSRR